MTSAPSWARARETTTWSALAGCSGSSSGQSASTSRAVLAPVRRSPASRARRPPQPRAGELLVAEGHPRQQGQLDRRGGSVGPAAGRRRRSLGHLSGLVGAPQHARQLLAARADREPLRIPHRREPVPTRFTVGLSTNRLTAILTAALTAAAGLPEMQSTIFWPLRSSRAAG